MLASWLSEIASGRRSVLSRWSGVNERGGDRVRAGGGVAVVVEGSGVSEAPGSGARGEVNWDIDRCQRR